MSQNQPARQQQKAPDSELDSVRSELASLRGSFMDLVRLILPASMRDNKCACGKISCTVISAIRAGESSVARIKLCEDCKLDDSWKEVGRFELGPAERESVRIANRICSPRP